MTPHDSGIELLVNHPDMLGIRRVHKVESEIPIVDPDFFTLTDIDVLYQHGSGISIVELKTGSNGRYGNAMRQLSIGSEYVRKRYGIEPDCFLVHVNDQDFTVLRSQSGVRRFEPITSRAYELSERINKNLPRLRTEYLPQSISLFGI